MTNGISCKPLRVLLCAALLSLGGTTAYAQANLEVFGQNRIQTRKYDWKYFDTKHFRIYHYDAAGRQLARYVSEQVENDIAIVEQKLGGAFPRRLNIILYNSYDEYKQSNIGRKYDWQLQDMPAGTVDLVGDKLVVYFNGEHADLRRQTRAGMSRVVMEHMLFGESFRQMVKNAVLLNLPEWTVNGYVSYLVDGWDSESNSLWKNLLDANHEPKNLFYNLAEKHPELAGKAFWKYIDTRYGESNMKSLLYTMQMKSSLTEGIRMTTGMKVKQAYDSVISFYRQVYAQDALSQVQPDSNSLAEIDVPTDGSEIRDIRVSPKGLDVAYVQWKNGEFQVYLQKAQKQQRSLIVDGGVKDYNEPNDPNYPLLAWSNNGLKLAILYRKGTQTRLRIYNSLKAQVENYVIPPNRFDRVLGMSFMEEDDKLVFSAIKKSQTDLYQFTIRGKRLLNITNDTWDDLQPWFVSGAFRRGILFLSNRPQPNLNVPISVNELPTGPMNLYFYDTKTKRSELMQCSYIKTGNITQPIQYGSENFAFLYDSNGIRNKYVVIFGRDGSNMDSAYAVPITNYSQNIISHQYNLASQQVFDVVQVGDKYRVYARPLQIPYTDVQPPVLLPTTLSRNESQKPINAPLTRMTGPAAVVPEPVRRTPPVLQSGSVFQTEFPDAEPVLRSDDPATTGIDTADVVDTNSLRLAAAQNAQEAQEVDSAYIKMRPQKYRHGFRTDFFSVRLDNTVLFTKYQSVAQNPGQFQNPRLGGMLTVSLDDVLENHRFTGGLRLPLSLSTGSAYFVQYQNFTRRVDWGLVYLRTESNRMVNVAYIDTVSNTGFTNEQLVKNTTNMLQGSAIYPLNRRQSIRLQLAFRQDRMNFRALDTLSLSYELPAEDRNQYWAMSRVEYVFDNTIKPIMNIYYGMRYKVYGEYAYQLNGSKGGFYNLGFDYRNYTKVYKNLIWATRIAGAHSGGNQKVLYRMGGIDNGLSIKQEETPTRTQNYSFQALATSMRGYRQNSWNGNTFALLNSELRLPILNTFMKRPVQSGFLKNLQAVGFVDVGSAWDGLVPNDATISNPITAAGPQVAVVLEDTRGVGLGYGAGLRTMIFGYYIRMDVAWNADDNRTRPMLHIGLGTDF